MRISISGNARNLDHATIRKALQWYARDLMPKLHTKLSLELDITTTLRKREGIIGAATCWYEDAKRKPTVFHMEMEANLSKRVALRILAHEMVHVKQFATGEMREYPRSSNIRWHGRNVRMRHGDAYWEQPWEIDSYGREVGLFYRFRRDTGI